MQFIIDGPDIPDELLQAHEEGRVVFFCGAGISYPAGLPGFKGLVEQIYDKNGTEQTEIEREVFERQQFDATLDLLERRLPGGRLAVRRALADALEPDISLDGATDTHSALLQLSRNRQGALRLVTTNFDRVFHKAAELTGQVFETYAAPMLPIPKNSRMNGVVYLHGLLPETEDDSVLNHLIITSGDFGLAYLTERWAARFVSELFRNYVVCFVGYSISDPVLRYMMDALAADRRLGEVTPQAWAVGDCEPGHEHRKTIEWESKGVKPILYRVPSGTHDHSALHKTLQSWATTYRDGVLGKERIVVNHALAGPSASTLQDDFVGRMLWALSDKTGLPAKRFADFNPAPSLDWLTEAFSDMRFLHGDLVRFDVPPRDPEDEELKFSLIQRPAPYNLAPPMLLVSGGLTGSGWDSVMFHLSRWLTRHLDDPRLILWIVQRGGILQKQWSLLIQEKLNEIVAKERDGKNEELDEIRAQAPKAIPSAMMRVLWRLVLCGRVKSTWRDYDLYSWIKRLKLEGLTTTLRLELRESLAPQVVLKKPFRWSEEEDNNTAEPISMSDLVDWELVLASDHVHSALCDVKGEEWTSVLPLLLDDFQKLLMDALDILREMGEADDYNDNSYWELPSISPHPQNRGYHDWVSLIELLRDAWLELKRDDSNRAVRIAEDWFQVPYPTFKRLALFAASEEVSISPERWVDWVLDDGAQLLWSVSVMREVLRLFVLQGQELSGSHQERLETVILAGPPRENYRDDMEPDRWQELMEHAIWLHLAKLESSGLRLGAKASEYFNKLSDKHPNWLLARNESDEFSHWVSGTGDPEYEERRNIDHAPRKRHELVTWLRTRQPEGRPFYEDTWRDVCRTRFFHSFLALCDLAKDDVWPTERWRTALQTWSEEGMVFRSWHYAAKVIQSMPDEHIQPIAHSVSWWIDTVSKSIVENENFLIDICSRLLTLEYEGSPGVIPDGEKVERPVTDAINHPVGQATQALINVWFKQNPNDNDTLPADIKSIFTKICDENVEIYRHGRVILGSNLIALFRVDRGWTEQYLFPLFSWDNAHPAKAVWEGFLWSPRLYPPLLAAFKSQFLDTANHYAELGQHSQHFAAFLTYAALGVSDVFSEDELRNAIGVLPQDGLEECAQALFQALEGAAEQREDYWENRILRFWYEVWPKSRELATPRIAESLTRLCIAAGEQFPSALATVRDWLKPIEHPHYVVHLLHDSGFCNHFPHEALQLLGLVIREQRWAPGELGECLANIKRSVPELAQDYTYQRLNEYFRRHHN